MTEADNGRNGDHDIIDTVYTSANPCSQASGLYRRKLPVSFVPDDARYVTMIYQESVGQTQARGELESITKSNAVPYAVRHRRYALLWQWHEEWEFFGFKDGLQNIMF